MAKRRKFTPEFKAELVFEVLSGDSSQAAVCRRHNINESQLSQSKHQLIENAPSLFASTDKQSSEVSEKRIAHLEQRVGRMAVALDIEKKLLTELDERYLKSDASFRHCSRSIPCEIFVASLVLTAAVSIINPKKTRPRFPSCVLK